MIPKKSLEGEIQGLHVVHLPGGRDGFLSAWGRDPEQLKAVSSLVPGPISKLPRTEATMGSLCLFSPVVSEFFKGYIGY